MTLKNISPLRSHFSLVPLWQPIYLTNDVSQKYWNNQNHHPRGAAVASHTISRSREIFFEVRAHIFPPPGARGPAAPSRPFTPWFFFEMIVKCIATITGLFFLCLFFLLSLPATARGRPWSGRPRPFLHPLSHVLRPPQRAADSAQARCLPTGLWCATSHRPSSPLLGTSLGSALFIIFFESHFPPKYLISFTIHSRKKGN